MQLDSRSVVLASKREVRLNIAYLVVRWRDPTCKDAARKHWEDHGAQKCPCCALFRHPASNRQLAKRRYVKSDRQAPLCASDLHEGRDRHTDYVRGRSRIRQPRFPRGVHGFQSGKSVSGESDPPSAKEMIFSAWRCDPAPVKFAKGFPIVHQKCSERRSHLAVCRIRRNGLGSPS